MAEMNPEAEAGAQSMRGRLRSRIGGSHTGTMAEAKVGINTDTGEIRKLHNELKAMSTTVRTLDKDMGNLLKTTNKVVGAVGGIHGAGQQNRAQNGQPQFVNTSTSTPTSSPQSQAITGGTGQGGGKTSPTGATGPWALGGLRGYGGGVKFLAGMTVANVAGGIAGALDARFDRGVDYSVAADRRSSVFQQMYGVSDDRVRDMRKPLFNYRIGPTGANAMMDFQRQTGFDMMSSPMAASLAGMRAASGYSKTTADVLTDMQSSLDPSVANRMYATMGVSPMQLGGRELTDPIKLQQQIVQRMGLTNRGLVETSFAPGSATRARMRDSGMTEEMIQSTLEYAQSNLTYKEQGGKGNYDPSKQSHRVAMGIEGNLSTQSEETEQARARREEKFMDNQYDAMVAMEKNTRAMVGLLESIETSLGTAIGLRGSTRAWTRPLGMAMQVGGAALLATGAGTALGAGLMVGGSLVAGSGDPTESSTTGRSMTSGTGVSAYSDSSNDSNIMVPFGYNGARKSLEEVKKSSTFAPMNQRMKDRMLAMMRANPNLGIGGGMRDTKSQESMFLDRYRPSSEKTDVFWNGKYWKRVKGAPAAPPGRSMHEIGLAADMVGDIDWMLANAAKFGLKTFENVNNEPWHIQPAELPNSRRKYEESGSIWGTDGGYDEEASFGPNQTGGGGGDHSHSEHKGLPGFMGSRSMGGIAGLSMSAILGGAQSASSGGSLSTATGWGRPGGGGSVAGGSGPGGGFNLEASAGYTNGDAPALTAAEVARHAAAAGFSGESLAMMVAIAKGESGYDPDVRGDIRLQNGKWGPSVGLWQIRSLNDQKGTGGNRDIERLTDPRFNARAAWEISSRGKDFSPWTVYNKGIYKKYMDEANQAVSNMSSGDPIIDMAKHAPAAHGGGGNVTLNSTPRTTTIEFKPVIQFHGTPQTPDLHSLAEHVGKLLRQEVEKIEMRNA